MAEKIIIEAEVKSNIGEVSKDASSAAGEFQVMGVSLNGVKAAFGKIIPTAKAMFGTIKAGIISTGIGALLIAVVSLFSYFKNTQKGAEMLERAMAGMGAVIGEISDLFAKVGEVIVGAFSDPQQAIKDLWEALKKNLMNRVTGVIDQFKALGKVIKSALSMDWDGVTEGAKEYGQALVQVTTGMDVEQQKKFAEGLKNIAKEMNEDVNAAMRLKGVMQDIRREEMEFTKVQAQTRQDVAKARLLAMDESKTQEERLEAINEVMKKELEMTANIIEMQKKKVAAKREELTLNKTMIEDEEELAALEVELINLTTQSTMTQKRLMLEVETLNNEIAAKQKAKQKEIADAEAKALKEIADAKEKAAKDKKAADKKAADEEIAEAKRVATEKMTILKAEQDFKKATIDKTFGAAAAMAGENVALSKGVAAAQVIYNTQQGIMAAMGATSIADKLLPYPLRLANAIATGVMGAAALSTIMSTNPTGGVNNPPPSTTGGTPAPEMMSGAFTLSGGVAPEPVQAYVVTDDMTNNQNKLAIIRRRATI